MFSAEAIGISNVEPSLSKKDEALVAGQVEAKELERRAEAVEAAVRVQGLREFFDLRKTWSSWIIAWISALIFFNGCLAVFVGAGWLNFLEYEWFITAVTVETFLQVVGMGYVAVRFLFSDSKK
ncbi:hypothetical protein GG681_12345 [Epibacterium sp. SM1969]|uniref:Uncharacterized protein n=1 Tax=Tritonibacter aquimaris TaxID=2663379 RepID=A0A844AYL5_9RHOB|nr:hypothetical protein [Tritonibacter aquimaris]MQY43434.1 hypothetical protein [Tritonibacter aquimaris]